MAPQRAVPPFYFAEPLTLRGVLQQPRQIHANTAEHGGRTQFAPTGICLFCYGYSLVSQPLVLCTTLLRIFVIGKGEMV